MADLNQTIRAKEQDLTKLKIQANQDKLKKLQSNQPVAEDDEEERNRKFHQLENAAKICVNEFESDEPYIEIIDGVAEEHGLDPIQLAKYLNDKGIIEEDELNEFIKYVNNTPNEDDEERRGDANGRWSNKRTGRGHRDDQGDEDAEALSMTRNESINITNFLKAISQKNYAQADKYLQGTVDAKLKATINKAINNSTIYAK